MADIGGDGETVQHVSRDLAGAFGARQVEASVGREYALRELGEPPSDIGACPRALKQRLKVPAVGRGQPASARRDSARRRKSATIATSEGLTPGMRPAMPSVRGRCRLSFSRPSRESAVRPE